MSNWNQYEYPYMSPCKECSSRHNRCHSTCEDYKVFRCEIDKVNNLRNKAKSKESAYTDYKIDGINKELKGKDMSKVKLYSVAVGNLNVFKRKSRQAMRFISKLDGLVGVHPCYPHGQLILFKTENDAKIGRNRMNGKGIQTGHNICEVYVDAKYVEGK